MLALALAVFPGAPKDLLIGFQELHRRSKMFCTKAGPLEGKRKKTKVSCRGCILGVPALTLRHRSFLIVFLVRAPSSHRFSLSLRFRCARPASPRFFLVPLRPSRFFLVLPGFVSVCSPESPWLSLVLVARPGFSLVFHSSSGQPQFSPVLHGSP